MQAYESLFWGMAALVLFALVGGSLMGRFAAVARSLMGVGLQSLAAAMVVAIALTRDGANIDGMVFLLAVATFMFCLVIGVAATLLSRRILRERRDRMQRAAQ